jgi:biopolymer transport protein ExbB
MNFRSTFRLLLLTAMIVAAGSFAGNVLPAQDAGSAAAAIESPGKLVTVAKLVFGNLDFVTVIIFILSVVAVNYIVRGVLQVRESVVMPEKTTGRLRAMIAGRQFQELLDYTSSDSSFLSKAIAPALKRAPRFNEMKEAMEVSIGEQTADTFRRLEILNIIGNLGPLLGLLGTVLGMIEAFDAMNRAGGSANPAQLASGIATALAHTFLGLFLAIPCLAAFGILRTRADRITTRAAIEAEELLMMIKPQENAPARPGPTPVRPTSPATA